MQTFDFQDGRGNIPAKRHINPDGTEGGWVAETATVASSVYVGRNAWVYGNARVSDTARVFGNARVTGNAQVSGNALVSDTAQFSEKGWTWGTFPAPSLEDQKTLAMEILSRVENGGSLLMSTWHTCGTSHCLAGWCQVLRSDKQDDDTAYEFGVRYLPSLAHMFFASDSEALKALKELAGV